MVKTREFRRARLESIFRETIRRLNPTPLVARAAASLDGERVRVIAVGKAAVAMARGALMVLGDRVVDGLVVAPDDADLPIDVMVAAHPTPDARSEAAGRALLERVARPGADRVLALVSGGASSLAAVPTEGLTLEDKIRRTAEVYAAGAPIAELNRVRTQLSAIKGGKLAAASAAPMTTFVLSDVVGDDVSVVGSGPTVLDQPPAHRERSPREARTESKGDVQLLAGVGTLADTAAAVAGETVDVEVFSRGITGDVADAAERIANVARKLAGRDACSVGSGEPTIVLPPHPGIGGRAQQLALLVARAIRGTPGVSVLVAGSDGIDGNSSAAGAVIDGATYDQLADPEHAIAHCDAHTALGAAVVVTGPTGTNHADLILILGTRS